MSREWREEGGDGDRSRASVDAGPVVGRRTQVQETYAQAAPPVGVQVGRVNGEHEATAEPQPVHHGVGDEAAGAKVAAQVSTLGQLGLAHLTAIESALAPAFGHAVAATDTAAVQAIRTEIVGGLARIVDVRAQMDRLMPGLDARTLFADAHAKADPAVAFAPSDYAQAMTAHTALTVALEAAGPRLAVQLSAQMFGGQAIAAVEALPYDAAIARQVAYESGLVLSLLQEADEIDTLLAPVNEEAKTSEPATEGARREAVNRLERWKGRPINFLFLSRVLATRGLWQTIQGVEDLSGRTAADLSVQVDAQAKETGTTADVGTWWNVDEARDLLTRGVTDWAVTDENALGVFEMLGRAEAHARAGLVKQLGRMGLLDTLCKNLPWGLVKELWLSVIDDDDAAALLLPHFEGKGGGESLGKRLRGADHWYTDTLDTALDFATLGAKPQIDDAYDAREAGLVSDDAYWTAVDKAVGRTGVVGAAMMVTGGAAGEFAGGFAEGLGAGAGGGLAVGAVTGGAVGSVGGHFAGDVYDQALNGKDGFDPLTSYGRSFGEGGLIGAAVAPLGLAAAKYLPEGMRTMAQEAAAAHPRATRLLEAARGAGVGAAVRVRMTVREFFESLGDGPPPGFRLAYAGGGAAVPDAIASAPPDAIVSVTVRPLVDLEVARPMWREGEEADLVAVDDVELDAEGLTSGERSALGEGPEVEAMHEVEPIPENLRIPMEGEDKGMWEGERGNSGWISFKPDVVKETGGAAVEFRGGYPDLRPFAVEDPVFLGPAMKGTDADFAMADEILANRKGWTKAEATSYRRSNRLTWHHVEGGTELLLVPRGLHSNIPHTGGASEARAAGEADALGLEE